MAEASQSDTNAGNTVLSQIAKMTPEQLANSPLAMAVLTKIGEQAEQNPDLARLEGNRGPGSRSHDVNLAGGLDDTQKLALQLLQNQNLMNKIAPDGGQALVQNIGNQFIRTVNMNEGNRAGGFTVPELFREDPTAPFSSARPTTPGDNALIQKVGDGMHQGPPIFDKPEPQNLAGFQLPGASIPGGPGGVEGASYRNEGVRDPNPALRVGINPVDDSPTKLSGADLQRIVDRITSGGVTLVGGQGNPPGGLHPGFDPNNPGQSYALSNQSAIAPAVDKPAVTVKAPAPQ